MDNLSYIRELGMKLYPDGDYQIVQIKQGNRIVKAFFLTEERAKEWAKYWPNSVVEKMEGKE